MAGPIHLFWTTGVFYIYELAENYNLYLIVPENYKTNEKFLEIIKTFSIKVSFLPEGNIFQRNRLAAKELRRVVNTFVPDFLLIHNRFYPDTLYLLFWCKLLAPNCIRISYQDGRVALDWNEDFYARFARDVEILKAKYPGTPGWCIKFFKKIHYRITYLIQIKILPLLFTGKVLRPKVDIFSGRVFNLNADVNFQSGKDFMLAYLECEAKELEHICNWEAVCIKHPLGVVGEKFFSKNAIDCEINSGILILPSYGFTSTLLLNSDLDEATIIKMLTENWIRALFNVISIFPNQEIAIKLHPASVEDKVWLQIVANMRASIPNIKEYSVFENAESLITKNKIIIGDVSSSLWWALLYGNKTVISLDLFGYRGGDEMKNYDGIHYITSLEQINISEFSKVQNIHQNLNLKTISEFLSKFNI